MSNILEPRKPQSKVKHEILEKYLEAWGGIIVNGLFQRAKNNPSFEIHLVYVDCFSFAGRYIGDLEDLERGQGPSVVYGSPIIGVNTLAKVAATAKSRGVSVRTNSILVERASRTYDELRTSLQMAGLEPQVRETDDFFSLGNGEIALVNADSTQLRDRLINYTQSGTKFSLYFLDPYGPKGIPMEMVGPIVRGERHDVMVNMPYQDLHKKSGIVVKPIPSSTDVALTRNYDAMFGNNHWQTVVREHDGMHFWGIAGKASASNKTLEFALMEEYKRSLGKIDKDIAIKSLALRFPSHEKTMFYLFLTTHDGSGALVINKILHEANYLENELRWQLREARVAGTGQLSFDILSSTRPIANMERPSIQEIADELLERLKGMQKVTRREIYRLLSDEPYFANEIDKAIRSLRGTHLDFEIPLKNNTYISIVK